MASMPEYESEQRGYDGETHPLQGQLFTLAFRPKPQPQTDEPRGGYDRERSRSPRGDRRDMDDSRVRSASPIGRDSR